MKVVVGLGNPGLEYQRTRHNVGFDCIDRLARKVCDASQSPRARFQALALEGESGGEKVLLLKPMTYMNASGEAVAPLARFYQIDPADIIVVHDDLDLDSGKLRLRRGGSSGGQNGIKSIAQHLGTQEFPRIKVGIGRPPGRMDPAAYVLQDFSRNEEEAFTPLRAKVCDALECWLFSGIEAAMNQFNG